jgi:transposase
VVRGAGAHLVENFFCNLKQFRRIAARYEKTDANFAAIIYVASTLLAMR